MSASLPEMRQRLPNSFTLTDYNISDASEADDTMMNMQLMN